MEFLFKYDVESVTPEYVADMAICLEYAERFAKNETDFDIIDPIADSNWVGGIFSSGDMDMLCDKRYDVDVWDFYFFSTEDESPKTLVATIKVK